MKKYIILTFIIFFLCGCSFHKEKQTDLDIIKERGYIIAGVRADSPPFGYIKDDKLEGIDVEIVKNIANSIFDTSSPDVIRFVQVDAKDRISKLNSKEVDILVATLSIIPKRKLVINFSRPYFVSGLKLMVRKDSKITHLQYFNSKGKLGVVMGTTGEKLIRLVAPNAQVVGAKNYEELIDMMAGLQIDGIVGDDSILQAIGKNKYKIINRIYSKEYYGVGVRKTEESKELLDVIDSTIASLVDQKKIDVPKRRLTQEDTDEYKIENGAKVITITDDKNQTNETKEEVNNDENKENILPKEDKIDDKQDINDNKEDTKLNENKEKESKTEENKDEQK